MFEIETLEYEHIEYKGGRRWLASSAPTPRGPAKLLLFLFIIRMYYLYYEFVSAILVIICLLLLPLLPLLLLTVTQRPRESDDTEPALANWGVQELAAHMAEALRARRGSRVPRKGV